MDPDNRENFDRQDEESVAFNDSYQIETDTLEMAEDDVVDTYAERGSEGSEYNDAPQDVGSSSEGENENEIVPDYLPDQKVEEARPAVMETPHEEVEMYFESEKEGMDLGEPHEDAGGLLEEIEQVPGGAQEPRSLPGLSLEVDEQPSWFKASVMELPNLDNILKQNEQQFPEGDLQNLDEQVSVGGESDEDESKEDDNASIEERESVVDEDIFGQPEELDVAEPVELALDEDVSVSVEEKDLVDLLRDEIQDTSIAETTEEHTSEWYAKSQEETTLQDVMDRVEDENGNIDELDNEKLVENENNVDLAEDIFSKAFTLLVPSEGISALSKLQKTKTERSKVEESPSNKASGRGADQDEITADEIGDHREGKEDMNDDTYGEGIYEDVSQSVGSMIAQSLNFMLPTFEMADQFGGKAKDSEKDILANFLAQKKEAGRKRWGLRSKPYHTDAVWLIKLENGNRLFSTSRDGSVKQWNVKKGRMETSFSGHKLTVYDYVIYKTSLISCSQDAKLIEYDVNTGRTRREFIGHEHPVTCLTISGNRLVSGDNNGTFIVWDLSTGKKVLNLSNNKSGINCMEQVKGFVYIGCADGNIYVWDVVSGRLVSTFEGHTSYVMHFAKDRRRLFSASADKTIRSWDCITLKSLKVFSGHGDWVNCITLRNFVLFSGSRDTTVRAWDPNTGACLQVFKGHTNSVRAIALNDNTLFSAGKDKQIRAWDIESGKPKWVGDGHDDWINSMTVQSDWLISGAKDDSLMIWKTNNGELKNVLANRKTRFKKLVYPKILGIIGLISVIIEYFQLCGVATSYEMDWMQNGYFMKHIYKFLTILQFTTDFDFFGGAIPRASFYISCLLVLSFLLLFLSSKQLFRVKYMRFLGWIWKLVVIYCWLMSTVLFIPLVKQLLLILRCNAYSVGAHHQLVTSLQCFGPEHLAYVVVALLLLSLYTLLCVRFLNVDGDLTRIAYHWWFTRKFDKPVLAKVNVVSKKSLVLDELLVAVKIILIASTVVLHSVPIMSATLFLVLFVIFWVACLLFPSYYSRAMGSVRLALVSLVVWTALVTLAAVTIDLLDASLPSEDYVFVPIYLIGYAIILPLVWVASFNYLVIRDFILSRVGFSPSSIVSGIEGLFEEDESDDEIEKEIEMDTIRYKSAEYDFINDDDGVETVKDDDFTSKMEMEIKLPEHKHMFLKYCPYYRSFPNTIPNHLEPTLQAKYDGILSLEDNCTSFTVDLDSLDTSSVVLRSDTTTEDFHYGYYFEVEVQFNEEHASIDLGFSNVDSLGNIKDFYGLSSSPESKLLTHSAQTETFNPGDLVGIGWNCRRNGALYISINGHLISDIMTEIPAKLFPTISISRNNDSLSREEGAQVTGKVNFGQEILLYSGYGENLKSPDEDDDSDVEDTMEEE